MRLAFAGSADTIREIIGRGRDVSCPTVPAQIRTCGICCLLLFPEPWRLERTVPRIRIQLCQHRRPSASFRRRRLLSRFAEDGAHGRMGFDERQASCSRKRPTVAHDPGRLLLCRYDLSAALIVTVLAWFATYRLMQWRGALAGIVFAALIMQLARPFLST